MLRYLLPSWWWDCMPETLCTEFAGINSAENPAKSVNKGRTPPSTCEHSQVPESSLPNFWKSTLSWLVNTAMCLHDWTSRGHHPVEREFETEAARKALPRSNNAGERGWPHCADTLYDERPSPKLRMPKEEKWPDFPIQVTSLRHQRQFCNLLCRT